MRLALVRRKLASRSELLLRILLSVTRRLLLPGPRRLVLLIQLSCGNSHLGTVVRLAVVRPAQQYIGLVVHGRVIDEHPLVIRLLFIEYPDRRIFALAGNANNRASTESLATNAGVAEDSVVVTVLAGWVLTRCTTRPCSLPASKTESRLSLPASPARIGRSPTAQLRGTLWLIRRHRA